MSNFMLSYFVRMTQSLYAQRDTIPLLALRWLLAWEFAESGYEKFIGTNWFADLSFPFPFNLLSPTFNWNLAMGLELIGALMLFFGLFTRFFSFALMLLTVVAIVSVHLPQEWHTLGELLRGYRIIDENGDGFGNYKLPLMYLLMFLPLLFGGGGRWSLDNWCLHNRLGKRFTPVARQCVV